MDKSKSCNIDLLDDVVHSTKESYGVVKGAVNFFSLFIANTIDEGAFESILVPYFGKFQPKIKEIQWRMQNKGVAKGGSIEEINKQIAQQNARTIQDHGDV